ncbi:MAG: MBL fold metallo-hydrolase [Capsulimonadales bacterium]|nr:MBL fold metallo-hydrolase [Capsulimonadales bacterium]
MKAHGTEIAPGVWWCDLGPVNAYLVGEPGGPWSVVDTGLSLHFDALRAAADARFGPDSRPEAIYLTHGHPDHAGSALALAAFYDAPVYVHRRELPFVTGRAVYPPPDPTVGGALAWMVRLYPPMKPIDLGMWVHALPASEGIPSDDLPGMAGWQVVETPGHAPGQVAFFRPTDRFLLAGDACTTVDLDWLPSILSRLRELDIPPRPATPDWVAARKSLRTLAALKPRSIACGHGVPMEGAEVATGLFELAEHFIAPLSGRYIAEPARFDENGVTFLPPKPADPVLKAAIVVGAAALAGWTFSRLRTRRKERS